MEQITETQAAALGGVLVGAGLILIPVVIIVSILLIIAMWKIFAKAGEAGWKSLIPIYNVYVFCKIIGISFWMWALLLPIVVGVGSAVIANVMNNQDISTIIAGVYSIIVEVYVSVKLAKAFNKGVGFTIGLILLPNLFQLILGFGSSEYVGQSAE